MKNVSQLLALFPVSAYAQIKLDDPGKVGNFAGPLTFTPERIISGVIGLIMMAVGVAFFIMLVMGGLKWVVSEGDKNNVEAARNQVTNALIGLAIVFSAWAALRLIGAVTGVDFFNITIPKI